jgi:hypothetical protein
MPAEGGRLAKVPTLRNAQGLQTKCQIGCNETASRARVAMECTPQALPIYIAQVLHCSTSHVTCSVHHNVKVGWKRCCQSKEGLATIPLALQPRFAPLEHQVFVEEARVPDR